MEPLSNYLDAVAERVVIFDGGPGTSYQTADLGPDDFGGPALEGCNELLTITRPDVVSDTHAAFLEVGVDVVETNTFGAFAVTLGECGIADRAHELNVAAARLAKDVANDFSTRDAPDGLPGRSVPGPDSRRSATFDMPNSGTPTRSRRSGCSRVASTSSSSRRCSTCSA